MSNKTLQTISILLSLTASVIAIVYHVNAQEITKADKKNKEDGSRT